MIRRGLVNINLHGEASSCSSYKYCPSKIKLSSYIAME